MAYRTSKPLHPTEFGKPKRTKVVTRGTQVKDGITSVRKKKVVTRRDGTVKNVGKVKEYKSGDDRWASRKRGEKPTYKYKWKKTTDSEGNQIKKTGKVKRTPDNYGDHTPRSQRAKYKRKTTTTSHKEKYKGGQDFSYKGKVEKTKMKKNDQGAMKETKRISRKSTRKIYK